MDSILVPVLKDAGDQGFTCQASDEGTAPPAEQQPRRCCLSWLRCLKLMEMLVAQPEPLSDGRPKPETLSPLKDLQRCTGQNTQTYLEGNQTSHQAPAQVTLMRARRGGGTKTRRPGTMTAGVESSTSSRLTVQLSFLWTGSFNTWDKRRRTDACGPEQNSGGPRPAHLSAPVLAGGGPLQGHEQADKRTWKRGGDAYKQFSAHSDS